MLRKALICGFVVVSLWCAFHFRRAKLSLFNPGHESLVVKASFRPSKSHRETTDWIVLRPRQRIVIPIWFRGVKPNFAVFGSSSADAKSLEIAENSYDDVARDPSLTENEKRLYTRTGEVKVWDSVRGPLCGVNAITGTNLLKGADSRKVFGLRFRNIPPEGNLFPRFAFEFQDARKATLHVASIKLFNRSNQEINVSLAYPVGDQNLNVRHVKRWTKVPARSSREEHRLFVNRKPQFFAFATTDSSNEALKSIAEETVYSRARSNPLIAWDGSDISLEFDPDSLPGPLFFRSKFQLGFSEAKPRSERDSFPRLSRWGDYVASLSAKQDFEMIFENASATVRVVECLVHDTTPFDVEYAYAVTKPGNSLRRRGWFQLSPGESRTIREVIRGRSPRLLFFGQSQKGGDNAKMISALYQGETQIFWNDREQLYDSWASIDTKDAFDETHPTLNWRRKENVEEVAFVPARSLNEELTQFQFLFEPPGESRLDHLRGDCASKEDLAERAAECHYARLSLVRQLNFQEAWKSQPNRPYRLGIGLAGEDRYDLPGIAVSEVETYLPGDTLMQLRPGDVIEWFGKKRVYGASDIDAALIEHAGDIKRGAKVAIPFVVKRGTEYISGYTTYWFNKEWWSETVTGIDALLGGAWDGINLGFGSETRAGLEFGLVATKNVARWAIAMFNGEKGTVYDELPDMEKAAWVYNQREEMAKQWFPKARLAGEIPTYFLSAPRSLLRQFGSKSMQRFSASMLGSVAFELAEGLVWSEIAEVPAVRSASERRRDILVQVTASSIGGAVPAVFSRIRRVP